MGKRTIFVDDLTGQEIISGDGTYTVSITLSISPQGVKDATGEVYKADWDTSHNTQSALIDLISEADLATFIVRMRPLVTVKDVIDSDVIRKWVRDVHPELKIKERGRVPADIKALYNREVVQRVNAADSGKTTPK